MRGRQQGMTLVELMVAITIGLALTAGIIQIFVSSKNTYRVEETLARLQESGRMALEFISNDIRMASYWGCQPDRAAITNLIRTTDAAYVDYIGASLRGTEGGTGADTLILRGADGTTAYPLQPNNGAGGYSPSVSASLQIAASNVIAVGNNVLVSDCVAGDIFKVTGNTAGLIAHAAGAGSSGNTTANLTNAYQGDAALYPMREVIYSIAVGANGQPALWRSLNGAAQEVVSDVTDLQILYGEDTNGDQSVDRYVPANASGLNFNNVYGIRVTLQVQTNVTGTSITGNRITRTFTTTVSVRNRVL